MAGPVLGIIVVGAVTTGIVGTTGATEPTMGDTPGVGTAAKELTPRLAISVESSGTPARIVVPGVDDDVGVEDASTPFEPDPHIPDIPDVSSTPEGVVIPELCAIPELVDISDVAEGAEDMLGKAAVSPAAAPVAGIALPGSIPPPSKLADEPNMPADEMPNVEQGIPLLGIAMVPVGLIGVGLTPGDVISVAPNGIPVPPTDEPLVMSSGDVALTDGVGTTMLCATAAWLARTIGTSAAIGKNLIVVLRSGLDLHRLNLSITRCQVLPFRTLASGCPVG
jgi:hypothetical protein